MKRNGRVSKCVGVLCLVAITTGCPGDPPEQPAPPAAPGMTGAPPAAPPATQPASLPPGVTAELVESGREVFMGPGVCFSCHGQDAQGTPLGPNLIDGNWIWLDPASPDFRTELGNLIRLGIERPQEYPAPMPSMGNNLSEDQIRAVSAYVLSLI